MQEHPNNMGRDMRYAIEAHVIWKRLKGDPGYEAKLKEDFATFTGHDFAVAPSAVVGTANLLAAVDKEWTDRQFNRILEEARALFVPAAFQVTTLREKTA